LLEGLRALRKGIKLPRVHPRRHDEIACPFRRRFDQERGFQVHETILMQIRTGRQVNGIPQLEVLFHLRPAQVQVTVFHPQIVSSVRIVLYRKWRGNGLVQDRKGPDLDLDIARWQLGILAGAFSNLSFHLYDEFPAQRLDIQLFIQFLTEQQLGDPIAVTQIDKTDAAEFPDGLYPSCQRNRSPDLGASQFSASVCSIHFSLSIYEVQRY